MMVALQTPTSRGVAAFPAPRGLSLERDAEPQPATATAEARGGNAVER
jgi:hypothetical protein